MTNPAQELRDAAARLGERAARTERGLAAALREGVRDHRGAAIPDRAAMDPAVGHALATWLETEAATWAGDEVHNRCSAQTCTLDAAVAVARAINGDPT